MAIAIGPSGNRLLAQVLDIVGVPVLAPQLTRVKLKTGQVLHEAGVTISYVYFPVDALISLMQVMASGETTETAIVGNDSMIGSELMMGVDRTTSRAVVQCDGTAYRLPIEVFGQELDRSPDVQRIVLASARALMVQTAQTVACNRHHALSQQLCRWLLLSVDRLPTGELHVTHEGLAHTLGVRRESVTLAASRLRDEGVIQYSRGLVRILDRHRLERDACECYRIVSAECERLYNAAAKAIGRPSVLHRTEGGTRLSEISAHRRPDARNDALRAPKDRRRGERRTPVDRRVRNVPIAFAERRASFDRRAGYPQLVARPPEEPAARELAG
ncbi:Crp/Fnr family transcriptional regulator [Solimonas variicoloris]|uniref:Crp/Fnr family transcriptional regulator n=1 Tax=Solimonas variicoloris TaxID=254408 RepID=UPI000381C5A7|nr:Crp/Fnr family transcriptional regulator [Solimonas variicoloris]